MDTAEKIRLVTRPPTSEVVTTEDLDALFASNQRPKHYIGLEISGFLHLGSLVSTGYKINDFADAGMDCTVFSSSLLCNPSSKKRIHQLQDTQKILLKHRTS